MSINVIPGYSGVLLDIEDDYDVLDYLRVGIKQIESFDIQHPVAIELRNIIEEMGEDVE